MTLGLETKKLKRTGYFPAFLAGGLLAAAFPLVNMLARSETFTALPGNPFDILTDANGQMMAMLNMLVSLCGACMMYHTEYADGGAQRMQTLPLRSGRLFGGKLLIASLVLAGMVAVETAALAGCAAHWFPSYTAQLPPLIRNAAFQWLVTLPTVTLTLVIASVCKNMWMSLGTGVILVFTLSIFPQDNPVLSLFPFSAPYQTLAAAAENGRVLLFSGVCAAEVAAFVLLELVCQKVRRCAE